MHNDSRASLDGSDSAFSLIDRGYVGDDYNSSQYASFDGTGVHGGLATPARQNSYNISSIIANPKAASTAATISTNLSNLNPLRSTTGPKTGATRGKSAVPIVVSDLPKVSRKDLQPYIESIRGEWEEWSKLDALRQLDAAKSGLQGLNSERVPNNHPYSQRNGSQQALPSLDDLPAIFSEENFSLANPRTFEAVTESEDFGTVSSGGSSSFRPTDQLLQEKLSHYLDVVEVHLNAEISERSDSFFSALANLQDLESQSAAALNRIAALKLSLSDVDTRIAEKGLSIGKRSRKRVRLKQLKAAVNEIITFWRDMETLEDLAQDGHSREALDLANELESCYHTERQNGALAVARDASAGRFTTQLGQLDALSDTASRLRAVRSTVCHFLQQEALTIAIELIAPIAVNHARPDPPPAEHTCVHNPSFSADKLMTILQDLARCGDDAISVWEWQYKASLQGVVFERLDQLLTQRTAPEPSMNWQAKRLQLDSLNVASLADGRAELWNHAVQLSHPDFLKLIKEIVDVMTGTLNSVEEQVTKVCSLIDGVTRQQSKPKESGDALTISTRHAQLSDTVQVIAEQVHKSIADVVNRRSQAHFTLSVFDFVALFDAIWGFILSSETIGRGMLVGLRSVMLAQAKSYLQSFHQAHLNSVGLAIERELWSPADVSARIQELSTLIVQSAVADPPDFLASPVSAMATGLDGTSKQLLVEDRPYFVVPASLSAVEALAEYTQFVMKLPILTIDAISKISEFLKQFNSRVCQVVLGAGAMRSAGLKNITAKHLALASQSLSLMISLIPYVREALRRHLRAKQAVILVDFDKVKRDFQEHQYEVHSKLVAIMADRLAVHCQTLSELDWNNASVLADGKPQAYMETLVKETTTLHKVLLRYLPSSSLEIVMMQVLSQIGAKLAEEYGRIELKSEAARSRMLADARYLKSKFGELKGFERPLPAAELEVLIEAKKVAQAPVLPTQKSFNTPSMTGQRASLSRGRTSSLVRTSIDHGPSQSAAMAVDATIKPEHSSATSPTANNADAGGVHVNEVIVENQLALPEEKLVPIKAPRAADAFDHIDSIAANDGVRTETEILPQDIALPPSPVAAAHATKDEATDNQEVLHVANGSAADIVAPIAQRTQVSENASDTNTSGDLPRLTHAKLPSVPTVNVKNRLASLFNKKQLPARPDGSGIEATRRASVASLTGPSSTPTTPERKTSLLPLPEQHIVAASSDVSASVSAENLSLPVAATIDKQEEEHT